MYYQHLDKNLVSENSKIIRDIAHDMLSTIQGHIKKDLPQVQTINTQCAQIEDQGKQISMKIPIEADITWEVKVLNRKLNFLEFVLKTSMFPDVQNFVGKDRI